MKYLSAILVFILALMLQVWFVPGGMRGDFVLSVLIVFALLFEFWELVAFILLGTFLINSSFHLDITTLLFALVPLIVYFVRRRFSLDPWLGGAVGIACGIVFLYVVTVPTAVFHAIGFLLLDILVCIIWGGLVLYGMEV